MSKKWFWLILSAGLAAVSAFLKEVVSTSQQKGGTQQSSTNETSQNQQNG